MRARHLPFKIGQSERDAWMRNMMAALNTVPELAPFKEEIVDLSIVLCKRFSPPVYCNSNRSFIYGAYLRPPQLAAALAAD